MITLIILEFKIPK